MNVHSWFSPTFISALQREHVSHILIKDFLEEEKARQLFAALCTEIFEKKQSDLFSLSQTQDFGGIKRGVLPLTARGLLHSNGAPGKWSLALKVRQYQRGGGIGK